MLNPARAMKRALKAQMEAWLLRSMSLPARMGPVIAAAEEEK
jgi:hypothetical protein